MNVLWCGLVVGLQCYDILPSGVGKHLVIKWLMENDLTTAVEDGGRVQAFAFGDRPAGNDYGLTTHEAVTFVSVSECPETVVESLQRHHVGHNVVGTALVLDSLVSQLETANLESESTLLDVKGAVDEARKHLPNI